MSRAYRAVSWLVIGAAALYVSSLMTHDLMASLYNAVNFNGFAADGPFQLFNPLRRLAAGELVGRDFQFFHGAGIPLLHLPLFWIMGSGIFGSEFSRWFVSAFSFYASSLIFFYATFRRWRPVLIAFTIESLLTVWLVNIVPPTNSLLNIRTTMPVLAGAVLIWGWSGYVRHQRLRWIRLEPAVMGLATAAALIMGTEQGIALGLSYGILTLATQWRRWRQLIIDLLVYGIITFGGAMAVDTVISGGHALAVLKYAFFEVPGDQSWYFSTQPQHFLSWHGFFGQLTGPFFLKAYAYAAIMVGMAVVLRKRKLLEGRQARTIWLFGMYGMAAFVLPTIGGYFADGQLIPLARVSILGITVLGVVLARSLVRSVSTTWLTAAGLSLGLALTVFAGMNFKEIKDLNPRGLLQAARVARHAPDYYVLSPGWKSAVDSGEQVFGGSKSIWSFYAGLYETQAGILHPSSDGHDYVIHALGQTRREAYEKQFLSSKSQYVVTLRPSYFPFEEWLWSRHWSAYREVFTGYNLIRSNSSHLFWQRTGTTEQAPAWQAARAASGGWYELPASSQRQLYEVRVKYRANGLIPGTNKLPKYLLHLRGSGTTYDISLPPNEQTWTFPITSLEQGVQPRFRASAEGIFPGQLKLAEVTYRPLNISTDNWRVLTEDYCFMYGPDGSGTWRKSKICDDYRASKF